ncbi:hypothetical protein ABPG73_020825 [Tetrahymena malaccensis]
MTILLKISFFFFLIIDFIKTLDYIKMPQVEIKQLDLLTQGVLSLTDPKAAQQKTLNYNFEVEFTDVPQILFSVSHLNIKLSRSSYVSFQASKQSINQKSFSVLVQKKSVSILYGLHVQYLAINNKDAYVINKTFNVINSFLKKVGGQIYSKQTYQYQRSGFDSTQWEVTITVFVNGIEKVFSPTEKLSEQFFHGQFQVVQNSNSFDVIFQSPDSINEANYHIIYINYLEFYKKKDNNYFYIQTQSDTSANPTNSTNPLLLNATPGNRTSIVPIYNVNVKNVKAIFYGLTGYNIRYDNFFRLEITGAQLQYNAVSQKYEFQYQYNTWQDTQVLFAQSQFVVLSQINCNQNNTLFLDDYKTCTSVCPPGYYKATTIDPVLGNINYCGKCDPACTFCNGRTSNDCLLCDQGLFYYNQLCLDNCPNGYLKNTQKQTCDVYTNYDDPNFYSCDKTCFQCNLADAQTNICTSCNTQTRYLDTDNTCKCLNQQDQRNNFLYCSYQNTAVTNYFLSVIPRQLVIDFGFQITSLSQNSNTPQSLCQSIFTPAMFNLLGPNPNCSIQGRFIILNFDDSSTLTEKQIQIQPSALQYVNSTFPITQFYNLKATKNFCLNSTVNFIYNPTQNNYDGLSVQFNGQIILFLVGRNLDFKTVSKTDLKEIQKQQNQQSNLLEQKNQQLEKFQEKIEILEKKIQQDQQQNSGNESKDQNILQTQKIFYFKEQENNLKNKKQVSPFQVSDLQFSNHQEDDFNLQQPQNQDLLIQKRKLSKQQQTNNKGIDLNKQQLNNSDLIQEILQEKISPYQIQYTQHSNDQENDLNLQKTENEELIIQESQLAIKQSTNNQILIQNLDNTNKQLQINQKQQSQQQQQTDSLSFKSEKR